MGRISTFDGAVLAASALEDRGWVIYEVRRIAGISGDYYAVTAIWQERAQVIVNSFPLDESFLAQLER